MITSALVFYQDPGSADPKFSPRIFFTVLAVYFFIFPTVSYLYIQQTGLGKKIDENDDGDHNEKQRLLGDIDEEVSLVETKDDVGTMSQQGVSESSMIYIGNIDNHKGDNFEKDHEFNNTLFYLTLAVCWLDFNNWGLIQVFIILTFTITNTYHHAK